MNRDFKGIWIPKEIWFETRLTIEERLLLSMLTNDEINDSECIDLQVYAIEFSKSIKEINMMIHSLRKYDYIK